MYEFNNKITKNIQLVLFNVNISRKDNKNEVRVRIELTEILLVKSFLSNFIYLRSFVLGN